jgi:hypothetical protein
MLQIVNGKNALTTQRIMLRDCLFEPNTKTGVDYGVALCLKSGIQGPRPNLGYTDRNLQVSGRFSIHYRRIIHDTHDRDNRRTSW